MFSLSRLRLPALVVSGLRAPRVLTECPHSRGTRRQEPQHSSVLNVRPRLLLHHPTTIQIPHFGSAVTFNSVTLAAPVALPCHRSIRPKRTSAPGGPGPANISDSAWPRHPPDFEIVGVSKLRPLPPGCGGGGCFWCPLPEQRFKRDKIQKTKKQIPPVSSTFLTIQRPRQSSSAKDGLERASRRAG